MIGGDAMVLISASSVNIGGSLTNDFFGNTGSFSGLSNGGSTIDGNATYLWDIIGDMTIQGDASLDILNAANAASPPGGIVHGSATIEINAANLTTGSLLVLIDNRNGGVIDSDASINLGVTGNLTSPGDVTFQILNNLQPGFGGGSIGGNADIFVTADTF